MINNSQDVIRVLLIDNNPVFLRVAADIVRLSPELLLVGALPMPGQMLNLAQQLQPQVILIDLWLPGLQDLSLIPRLHNLLPSVVIIALSLLDINDFYRQAALSIGADDHVQKKTLVTDLLPVIRRARQTQNNSILPERRFESPRPCHPQGG